MKSLKKLFISTTLSILIVSISSISSYSYLTQNYGWPTPNITLKNSTTSAYTTTVNNSLTAWNNATPIVNLSLNNKSSNVIYSGSYADTWVGLYSYYLKNGQTYMFNIKLNDRLLASKSANYKQSVLVHELGHALSLADNPPQSPSIMRYDRNRDVMIVPQQDDINGVNTFYGNK